MQEKSIESLWSHLHWLVILSEQGSYTAAAARLGVSKAAMSQRIAELERAVGLPLVRRTTRSMRLTEHGQRLVDETREPFRQIAHSFLDSRDHAAAPTGLLRISAPVALGRQQLLSRVAEFLLVNPTIRIEMELSDRLSSLATEGFDLAIRHSDNAPDTHVAWLLCRTSSVLVASHAYLMRCGVPNTPAELSNHACLYYPRAPDEKVWSFEPRTEQTAVTDRLTIPIAGPLAVNNSEALRDAAQAGLGIALLPDFSAQAALTCGLLVRVLPDWTPVGAFADRIHAIRPYASHVPRALTLFVQHLRDSFATGFGV